jgi:dsRNA-specific ribonuclease
MKQYLYSILLLFRTYEITFTEYIAKIRHQDKLYQYDRNFQRFLRRNSDEEPLRTYELAAVTYDTLSSKSLYATGCRI